MRRVSSIVGLLMLVLAAGCASVRSASQRAPLQRPVGAGELERIARAVRPGCEVTMQGSASFAAVTVRDGSATVTMLRGGDTVEIAAEFGAADPTPAEYDAAIALQRDLAAALDRAGITVDLAGAPLQQANFGR